MDLGKITLNSEHLSLEIDLNEVSLEDLTKFRRELQEALTIVDRCLADFQMEAFKALTHVERPRREFEEEIDVYF